MLTRPVAAWIACLGTITILNSKVPFAKNEWIASASAEGKPEREDYMMLVVDNPWSIGHLRLCLLPSYSKRSNYIPSSHKRTTFFPLWCGCLIIYNNAVFCLYYFRKYKYFRNDNEINDNTRLKEYENFYTYVLYISKYL